MVGARDGGGAMLPASLLLRPGTQHVESRCLNLSLSRARSGSTWNRFGRRPPWSPPGHRCAQDRWPLPAALPRHRKQAEPPQLTVQDRALDITFISSSAGGLTVSRKLDPVVERGFENAPFSANG